MEQWELDFKWLRVRHLIKDLFKREQLPDLNAILLLIGVQELGRWKKNFSKEEKQDLMHIAVCRLLESEGVFKFAGRDADGWPHWKQVQAFHLDGVKQQEWLLKEKVIDYFEGLELEHGGLETKN